jgi:pimeloyl-ACP methyl ester carboxylesterase
LVDAGSMKYEVSGSGTGSPIVLVPGGLSGWASWKPHAEALSKSHTVVRVQLVNMAAAEEGVEPPPGYSLRTESLALGKTIDKLGFKKTNLVGWSHGGEVSLDYALNNPERITTLTLIEPAAYWVLRGHGAYTDEDKAFESFIKGIKRPVSEEDLIRFLKANGLVPPGVEPKQMPRWPPLELTQGLLAQRPHRP